MHIMIYHNIMNTQKTTLNFYISFIHAMQPHPMVQIFMLLS